MSEDRRPVTAKHFTHRGNLAVLPEDESQYISPKFVEDENKPKRPSGGLGSDNDSLYTPPSNFGLEDASAQSLSNKIHGLPCYLVFKSLDYLMDFNNQNVNDEVNTKLLLMLPMVPKKEI